MKTTEVPLLIEELIEFCCPTAAETPVADASASADSESSAAATGAVSNRMQARRPPPSAANIALCLSSSCCFHCLNKSREMITRMISLVPSRIWWTRRSRTMRSMP